MATAPFSTLQLFSSSPPPPPKPYAPSHSLTTRATPPDSSSSSSSDTNTPDSTEPTTDSDNFENRLSNIRLRYRSGTGKKAEVRKSRKSKKTGSSGASVYLPPVPLKEPISGGLKVEFGFSPYSERVNGRVALLGLAALLLVELATGKSVIKYHSAEIVFVQMYFVAAATAMYSKFEKERISVWPKIASTSDE